MDDSTKKTNFEDKPIERHSNASWANMENIKPVSKVNIPSEIEVRNAKEYVDSNEK